MTDAEILRAAAEVMQRRSTKPNSIWLQALLRVMR